MTRVNTHDKYRDEYEKMGFEIVDLEPDAHAVTDRVTPEVIAFIKALLAVLIAALAAYLIMGG